MDYSSSNKLNISIGKIAEYTSACFNYDFNSCSNNFLPAKFEFIKENMTRVNLDHILKTCVKNNDLSLDQNRLDIYEKLISNDVMLVDIEKVLQNEFSSEDGYYAKFEDLLNITKSYACASELLSYSYKENVPVEYFIKLWDKALAKKHNLETAVTTVTEAELVNLLFSNVRKTLETIDFLGEKTFFYSFINKKDKVQEYIRKFGYIKYLDGYESMVEIINPRSSKRYRDAEENIRKLKLDFCKDNGVNRIEKIKEIRVYNNVKKEILANSITDPYEALNAANIYLALQSVSKEMSMEVIPFLSKKNISNKNSLKILLNEIILKHLLPENTKDNRIFEVFDFSQSKYLDKMFNTSASFQSSFLELLDSINLDSDVKARFNHLEQNIRTKELFEKYGIDYDKWIDCDSNSFYNTTISKNAELAFNDAVQSLMNVVNLLGNKYADKNVVFDIKNSLEKSGYMLEQLAYGKDDLTSFSLLKQNNQPLNYFDLVNILSIFKPVYGSNSNSGSSFQSLMKANSKMLIEKLETDIKMIEKLRNFGESDTIITIKKSNMNNISEALFLGNYSGCCTAIGKFNEKAAPNYIFNKMFSSIEVRDAETPIGNTMCYFALVNGELGFIIENIELHLEYQYKNSIRDGIIEYAKKLREEVGKPGIPIYAGAKRQEVDFTDFDEVNADVRLVGSSGKSYVYCDLFSNMHKINDNEVFKAKLYCVG